MKMRWHETGKREIEAGVSEVALFPMGANGYDTGVAWDGVTAINENPSGADVTDLYADNIKYASMRSAERFGFTVEAYTFPDEWAECDGSKEVTPGVFLGQQNRKAFGLAYKSQIGDELHPGMDKGFKLHLIYNSTASPSGRSYGTINENPDAISFSWEANSTPVAVTGHKATCEITIDSTKFTTAAQQKALQDLLDTIYGRDAVEADPEHNIEAVDAVVPTLPTPDEVLAALNVA